MLKRRNAVVRRVLGPANRIWSSLLLRHCQTCSIRDCEQEHFTPATITSTELAVPQMRIARARARYRISCRVRCLEFRRDFVRKTASPDMICGRMKRFRTSASFPPLSLSLCLCDIIHFVRQMAGYINSIIKTFFRKRFA